MFTTVDTDDPVALVVSLNVKRRNLTAGQRAVSAAEAWDMVGAGTKDDSRAKKLAREFGVNNAYVSQARALVQRAPDAAREVKDGKADLNGTYDALLAAERAVEDEQAHNERLRQQAEAILQRMADDREAMLDLEMLPPPTLEQLHTDIPRGPRGAGECR